MRPIAIDKLKKVKEVSCGDEHTLILSSEGNLDFRDFLQKSFITLSSGLIIYQSQMIYAPIFQSWHYFALPKELLNQIVKSTLCWDKLMIKKWALTELTF